MLNTTGCGVALARDTLLIPASLQQLIQSAECFFSFPLYYILVVGFLIILLLVALVRTKLVMTNNHRRQFSSKSSTWWNAMPPIVTLSASWASFGVLLLLMVLPLVVTPLNNSLIFLIGLQYTFFNILSERFYRKLLRLGAKIISLRKIKNNHSSSSGADDDDSKSLEYLKHADLVLSILHGLIIIGIGFQFLCLCVLCMIFPDQSIWLRIGVGMEGFNIFCPMCALIWQYQRCSTAIAIQAKKVRAISQESRSKLYDSVLLKFRRHQFILALFGIPGSLIYVLLGADVLKISYIVIVVNAFLDAFVNCGVLVTFLKKSNTKAIDNTTNLASGSIIAGEGVAAMTKSVWVTQGS